MRAFLLALGLASYPASAMAEEWAIQIQPDGCAVTKTYYQGVRPTTFTIIEHDFGPGVMIQNEGWSVERDQEYELGLRIDGHTYRETVGGGTDGALIAIVGDEVIDAIRRGRRLVATIENDQESPRILEDLDLSGSADAVARVRACNYLRLERIRRAEIVKPDPFKN